MEILFGILGMLMILGGIISIVRATDWRDRPKTALQPVKATFVAEEVITVSRRRTVKATKGV